MFYTIYHTPKQWAWNFRAFAKKALKFQVHLSTTPIVGTSRLRKRSERQGDRDEPERIGRSGRGTGARGLAQAVGRAERRQAARQEDEGRGVDRRARWHQRGGHRRDGLRRPPVRLAGREQARRRGRGGRRHRGRAVGPQARRHLHRGGRRGRPRQVGRAQRELVRRRPQGAVRRAARGREGEGPRLRAAGHRGLLGDGATKGYDESAGKLCWSWNLPVVFVFATFTTGPFL